MAEYEFDPRARVTIDFTCDICGESASLDLPAGQASLRPRPCDKTACKRTFEQHQRLQAQIEQERQQRKTLQGWVTGIVIVAVVLFVGFGPCAEDPPPECDDSRSDIEYCP